MCFLYYYVVQAIDQSIRYSKHYRHPRSNRRFNRARRRYKPRHLSYHAYKRRLKLKHRFRKPGFRSKFCRQYETPKIPKGIIIYFILRRHNVPTTSWLNFVAMRTVIRRIYMTNIIGLAILETAIHLAIKWLVPPIFIEIINWIISKFGRHNIVANAAVHFCRQQDLYNLTRTHSSLEWTLTLLNASHPILTIFKG